MGNYFLDTNAIVKFYHVEKGTTQIVELIQNQYNTIFISDISIIETISAFAKKVRNNEISVSTFTKFQKTFFGDIVDDIFIIIKYWEKHYNDAISLINKYAAIYSLNTIDALQLSIASELYMQKLINTFVSSDHKLNGIVFKEKINVYNPEIQSSTT